MSDRDSSMKPVMDTGDPLGLLRPVMAAAERTFPAEDGDYRDEEGFLCCGKCHGRKEMDVTLPPALVVEGGKDKMRVRVGCECQKKAEEARRQEEERRRQEEENRRQEEENRRQEEENNGGSEEEGGGESGGSSGSSSSSSGWLYPLPYRVAVTSAYGYRVHPVTGAWSFHTGVDLGAAEGTPIYATRSGTVTTATYSDVYGNYVTINHGDGYSSLYGHMTHYVVSAGEYVSQGEVIGYVGSTGWSTGPHLHFTIYYNGSTVNPMDYI